MYQSGERPAQAAGDTRDDDLHTLLAGLEAELVQPRRPARTSHHEGQLLQLRGLVRLDEDRDVRVLVVDLLEEGQKVRIGHLLAVEEDDAGLVDADGDRPLELVLSRRRDLQGG